MNISVPHHRSDIFDNLILSLLIFLVIFTPLAFGATQPWAIFVFQTTVTLMTILWLLKIYATRQAAIRTTFLYVPILFFILLVLFQLVPLPAGLVKVLSPKAYEIKTFAYTFLEKPAGWFSLSLYNHATHQELLKFVCYALVFFLVLNTVKTLKQVNTILCVLLVLGFLIALFAIIQKFTWNGKVYWLYPISERYGVFGPFVNYDHYGGYMNMMIMIGFGFLLSGIDLQKKVLIGFMVAIMGVSLLLSRSRGAVLSLAGGLTFLAFLILRVRSSYGKATVRSIGLSILSVLAIIALFIYWIDLGTILSRWKEVARLEGNFFNPRLDIWRDSFVMVKDFALTGTGYGTYSVTFPMYQKSYPDLFWRYAHNDYLQMLIETGPAALLMALTFIVMFFRSQVYKVRTSTSELLTSLLSGSSAAVVTLLLHSFVDFNLHITANALLFTLLLGLSIAMSSMSRDASSNSVQLPIGRKTAVLYPLAGISIIALFVLLPVTRHYVSQRYFDLADAAPPGPQKTDLRRKAVIIVPRNAAFSHALGLAYQESAAHTEQNASGKLRLLKLSQYSLGSSLILSPSEGKYWASFGWLLGNLTAAEKAEDAFRRGLVLAPESKVIQHLYRAYSSK